MNKSLSVTTYVVIFILIQLLSPTSVQANTSVAASDSYIATAPVVSKQLIKERLENLSSVIDIQYTEEVGRRIKEYTVSYRIAGEKILGKVDLYFPLFENEITMRNLPDELKYVAVVESHLDITAVSRSGAVGLWQFMKSTAQMQGLTVNRQLDERKDAVKSTKAALDYLNLMYEKFGDWTLAIAAYNCGPGGVRKAMRRSGQSDYWSIRRYLPKETQKYVPRIIAAMYLMQYYHTHDLTPRMVDMDLRQVTSITDGKAHNLTKLSKELGVDHSILKQLNTKYITGLFPKNKGNLELRIPSSSYERYLELHAPEAYKLMLLERREQELIALKENQVIARKKLEPLHAIRQLVFDNVRQKHRPKKYYRIRMS